MITFLAHKSNIPWCPEFFPYYVSICKRSWFVAQTMTCRIRIRWQKLVRMLKVVLFQEILEDWQAHLIWRSIGMQIKSLHKYVHLLTSSSIGKSLPIWFMATAARPLLFFWRESVTRMPNHFYSKKTKKTKQKTKQTKTKFECLTCWRSVTPVSILQTKSIRGTF